MAGLLVPGLTRHFTAAGASLNVVFNHSAGVSVDSKIAVQQKAEESTRNHAQERGVLL